MPLFSEGFCERNERSEWSEVKKFKERIDIPKTKRPTRGSMGFYPRKRARRIYPRIKNWPRSDEAKPLGFAGYKAGMTHALIVDANPNTKTKGQIISRPVTILDCPSLFIFGFLTLSSHVKGKKTENLVLAEKFEKNLKRKIKLPKDSNRERQPKAVNLSEKLEKIKNPKEDISEVRLICHTKPGHKKKPDVFEIALGGKVKEQLEYAKTMLGKELKISDIFKEGDYIDVCAVTKGKGFQGPVKRFGVTIQGRKCEHEHRKIAPKGQKEPGKVRHTVPQGGQLGFFSRTEFNKRIIKITKSEEVVPKGGILRYGFVKGDAVLIDGSVPGPSKRLIRLRAPMRDIKTKYPVDVKYISTGSKQGV